MTKILNCWRIVINGIGLALQKFKSGVKDALVTHYLWHPTLGFIFMMDSMIDCFEQAHTKKESIELFFTFFFCNALLNAVWSYRRHLIEQRKEEEMKKRYK